MKYLFAFFALLFAPAAAFAADGTITIPVGDWISSSASILQEILIPVLLALVARVLAILPTPVAALIKTLQVEQILTRAIGYGINAVQGAEHGKVLTVQVGNSVVAEAVNYVIQNGPSWLIKFLGGPEGIKQRILARVNLEANASLGIQKQVAQTTGE